MGQLDIVIQNLQAVVSPDPGYIYVVEMEGQGVFKIGRARNVQQRLSQFAPLPPFPYKLRFAHKVFDYIEVEKVLHHCFRGDRLHGEWFRLCAIQVDAAKMLLLFMQAGWLIDRVKLEIEKTSEPVRLIKLSRLLITAVKRNERRLGVVSNYAYSINGSGAPVATTNSVH